MGARRPRGRLQERAPSRQSHEAEPLTPLRFPAGPKTTSVEPDGCPHTRTPGDQIVTTRTYAPVTSACASHPDFHRRYRNFTGSTSFHWVADCNRRLGITPTPEHASVSSYNNSSGCSYWLRPGTGVWRS